MRRQLEALGAPVPRFAEVIGPSTTSTTFAAGQPVRWSKTVRGGYDGRGVRAGPRPRRGPRGRRAAISPTGSPVLVEERVTMRRELSALVARSPFGQGAAWPVVETVQRDGICVQVIAPAPDLPRGSGRRGAAAGAAAGRRARRGRRAGGRAVRDRPTARCWSTSWRCVRTTPATGPWTARAPASSSSTCARCWTIRSATPTPSPR